MAINENLGLIICSKARLGWCLNDSERIASEINARYDKEKLTEVINYIKEMSYEDARRVVSRELVIIY